MTASHDGASAPIRDAVRERYGRTAGQIDETDDGTPPSLGVGDPVALARLAPDETVLDLGSGPGRDLIAAANAAGRAIGVDMTPQMRGRAAEAVDRAGLRNVSILDGDLERLPVACGAVDVVISNCVVNLVADKRRAMVEAYRVLRPGGRLAVMDTAFEAEPPAAVREDPDAWCACVGGALVIGDYERLLRDVGFEDVSVTPADECCSSDGATTVAVAVTARKAGEPAAGPAIRPAVPADLPAITALLDAEGLPSADLRVEDASVALDGAQVVGAVALERYGPTSLLRSLVVAPTHRRTGLGRRLLGAALDVARWSGAQIVYATTATAQGFLERVRFEPVSRARATAECPAPQLRSAQCSSAATLRLDFEAADLPLLGRPSRKPLPTFDGGSCC